MRTGIQSFSDVRSSVNKRFAVDTTFVLFFLAVDLGESFTGVAVDSLMSMVTLAVFVAVPFLLPSERQKPGFAGWLAGRAAIAGFGIVLGLAFRQTLGSVLPETFRFLPITLLIVAAMLCCYIQFYGLLKFRWAK
jgi:hypothetical protein